MDSKPSGRRKVWNLECVDPATVIDHTIDREKSVEFYARIFGYEDPGEAGPFGAVRVNDTFNLDFQDTEDFNSIHYAFAMDVEEFEVTFSTIKKAGIPYGDGPRTQENRKSPGRTNGTKCKGPKIYFKDLRGQVLEIKTY